LSIFKTSNKISRNNLGQEITNKTFRIQNLELDIVEINAKLDQQINERTTIISAREKDLSELEVFHLISFFNYCLYLSLILRIPKINYFWRKNSKLKRFQIV
jgi:hypothetical protein